MSYQINYEIVTEDSLANIADKEFFNGLPIKVGDKIFWCYVIGDLLKKNEIEKVEKYSSLLTNIKNRNSDFYDEMLLIKNVKKVAFNESLYEKTKDKLNYLYNKDGIPTFEFNGDINEYYGESMKEDFINKFIYTFGEKILQQINFEFDNYNQELSIHIMNMSYHTKIFNFLKDEFFYDKSNVAVIANEKYFIHDKTSPNERDEDAKISKYMSYTIAFNNDKDSYLRAYNDLYDLSDRKTVFSSKDNGSNMIAEMLNKKSEIEKSFEETMYKELDEINNK